MKGYFVWEHTKEGNPVIDAQLKSGYESGSGFRDAFSRIMGAVSTKHTTYALKAACLDTKLGPVLCIADEQGLYLLEFVDQRSLERKIERMRRKFKMTIIPGETRITHRIKKELNAYFNGNCFTFNTPVYLLGSPFQKQVWEILKKIPPGETRSYLDIAKILERPTAFRAVAQANGANQLALIIPCHRVINANGDLGGYGGGVARKQWLLEHEKRHAR